MEGETNQAQQQQPQRCRAGCGFYGNQSSDGLCSKCYKDTIKRSQDASASQGSINNTTATMATGTSMLQSSSSHSPKLNSVAERTSSASPLPTAETSIEKVKDDVSEDSNDATEGATSLDTSLDASASSPDKAKKKNRCYICRKKVGLTGFQCRCNGLYCGIHRYSDKHNCSFDYKADGREQIAKQNPVVVGEKVKKI